MATLVHEEDVESSERGPSDRLRPEASGLIDKLEHLCENGLATVRERSGDALPPLVPDVLADTRRFQLSLSDVFLDLSASIRYVERHSTTRKRGSSRRRLLHLGVDAHPRARHVVEDPIAFDHEV